MCEELPILMDLLRKGREFAQFILLARYHSKQDIDDSSHSTGSNLSISGLRN